MGTTVLAPWREPLARALHRNRALAYARYGQLATVGLNGRPANRTVVFRGFRAGGNGLLFVCDRRSQKLPELQRSPWAELCWYFPKTREQFRLGGRVAIAGAGVVGTGGGALGEGDRQTAWQSLSDAARESFYWPTPGAARSDPAVFFNLVPDPEVPPDSFVLLVLEPDQVDHLELRGEPQNRWQYRYSPDPSDSDPSDLASDSDRSHWSKRAINP